MFFIFPFIFEGVFAVVFVIVIITIIKAVKKNKEQQGIDYDNSESKSFKNTISNANDDNAYWNSISSEDSSIKCTYCGSSVMRSRRKCPSCGAKIDKTTNKKQ